MTTKTCCVCSSVLKLLLFFLHYRYKTYCPVQIIMKTKNTPFWLYYVVVLGLLNWRMSQMIFVSSPHLSFLLFVSLSFLSGFFLLFFFFGGGVRSQFGQSWRWRSALELPSPIKVVPEAVGNNYNSG